MSFKRVMLMLRCRSLGELIRDSMLKLSGACRGIPRFCRDHFGDFMWIERRLLSRDDEIHVDAGPSSLRFMSQDCFFVNVAVKDTDDLSLSPISPDRSLPDVR